jgi:radical SAM superfamily enzyme YgiQ (UPF0313 family)
MHKIPNVNFVENKYQDAIKKIHKANILVKGTFIYNNDEETFRSIINSIDEVVTSDLDVATFRSLLPFPGTALYKRLKQDNRLLIEEIPENWEKLQWIMTHKTNAIQSYYDSIKIRKHILKSFFNKKAMTKRMIKAAFHAKSLRAAIFTREDSGKVHETCIEFQKSLIK